MPGGAARRRPRGLPLAVSCGLDRRLDRLRDLLRSFMLPVAQHNPPGVDQCPVRLGVALTVAHDLLLPVVGMGLGRRSAVLGAAVPEAAVDEHRDLEACEDDVGPAAQVGKGAGVDPITQPMGVQQTPHGHFRLRIARPIGLH